MAGRVDSQSLELWSFETGTTDPIRNIAIPTKGTFPLYSALVDSASAAVTATTNSGTDKTMLTISSSDWPISNMDEGDYIYVAAQGIAQKIQHIYEAKLAMQIKFKFGTALAAEPILVAKKDIARTVNIKAIGSGNTATVMGIPLKSGEEISYAIPADVEVITYDASGGDALAFNIGY